MLTFRFKKLSESKLELKFWDDCWFIEGSDPFNISQVFDEIGVFIMDVGLEPFHSGASTKRVPEVYRCISSRKPLRALHFGKEMLFLVTLLVERDSQSLCIVSQ